QPIGRCDDLQAAERMTRRLGLADVRAASADDHSFGQGRGNRRRLVRLGEGHRDRLPRLSPEPTADGYPGGIRRPGIKPFTRAKPDQEYRAGWKTLVADQWSGLTQARGNLFPGKELADQVAQRRSLDRVRGLRLLVKET